MIVTQKLRNTTIYDQKLGYKTMIETLKPGNAMLNAQKPSNQRVKYPKNLK